ncbi:methionine synthase, partial [bacterium]|nr:methionine synthase [bacterium]
GLDPLTIEDDGRPYIVGERTNVIGSRAFKAMITEEKFEEAAEIARKQVKAGAHIIDVCLSNPDRNEVTDITAFMSYVSKLVKAPFMIDSQVPEVIEAAFKLTQGKCILNSVNLEDEGKFMKALMPVVQRYGAAIVVGCIDSEMAVTADDKLRIAENSYQVLTETYGIAPEDIIFDPLVFPCGTGDAKYFGSGKETIEGIRLIKDRFPKCKTVLGISNVSFGLPTAGREVLNSVFLYHCSKAGLDMAIVNAENLVRFAQISEDEKALCDDLIWYRTDNENDPVARFASHFRNKKSVAAVEVDRSTLSLDERIEINIVQGTKEYLIENLDLALAQMDPLGVINGPLMRAMDIVGKMFNNNELIVAEVLQSAEVMKTAVRHLEQFMSKADTNVRGTILLATVKGDVHDIGKNLVQIILSNNGYNVVDLGIKCPPETLIQAYHDHSPNLIGLSGLLVKSAQQMVITATDLKTAGISVPILVGGAALTEAFTATKIAPEYGGPVVYCKDAMTGLSVANTLMDPNTTAEEIKKITDRQAQVRESGTTRERGSSKREFKEKLVISHDGIEVTPPSLSQQIITADIQEAWKFLNLQMVFGNHLGYKGNIKNKLERGDEKLLKLVNRLDELKQRIVAEDRLTAKAVVQYFNAKRHGDSILIYNASGTTVIETFTFPRQSDGLNLCLADFVAEDRMDSIGMFVATCGDGVAEIAKELLNKGDYFDSHGLSAIALESAEAFAEYLHTQMRKQWGIPDQENTTLEDIFKLKYTGVRVSFGYPACPRLEDQEKMFKLLNPERIGITLSEEYMMHPEASVSALVFHHPQARYFTISEADLAAFEGKLTTE